MMGAHSRPLALQGKPEPNQWLLLPSLSAACAELPAPNGVCPEGEAPEATGAGERSWLPAVYKRLTVSIPGMISGHQRDYESHM